MHSIARSFGNRERQAMHSIARSFGEWERQAMHSIARSFGEWERFALPFSLSDTRQPELFLKFADL